LAITVAVTMALGAACVQGADHAGSMCAEAASILSKPSLPADGGTLVEDLRGLDLVGLTAVDQEAIIAAVNALEGRLKRFNTGTNVHTWDTVAVVDQVNRICNAHIASYRVES
jgi:hypothetical protein